MTVNVGSGAMAAGAAGAASSAVQLKPTAVGTQVQEPKAGPSVNQPPVDHAVVAAVAADAEKLRKAVQASLSVVCKPKFLAQELLAVSAAQTIDAAMLLADQVERGALPASCVGAARNTVMGASNRVNDKVKLIVEKIFRAASIACLSNACKTVSPIMRVEQTRADLMADLWRRADSLIDYKHGKNWNEAVDLFVVDWSSQSTQSDYSVALLQKECPGCVAFKAYVQQAKAWAPADLEMDIMRRRDHVLTDGGLLDVHGVDCGGPYVLQFDHDLFSLNFDSRWESSHYGTKIDIARLRDTVIAEKIGLTVDRAARLISVGATLPAFGKIH
jgi:hypothetical protein